MVGSVGKSGYVGSVGAGVVGSVGAGVGGSVGESGCVGGWCQKMVVVGCGVYVGTMGPFIGF